MSYFWLGRKYQQCKSLHIDSFLKVLDVDPVLRKMENSLRSIVEITYKNETEMFTMTTQNDYLSNSIMFKLGEKFIETTCDGRKCESIITLSGNTLVHVQKYPKVKAIILRQFCEYGMLAAFVASGKKAFRMYIMENAQQIVNAVGAPNAKETVIAEETQVGDEWDITQHISTKPPKEKPPPKDQNTKPPKIIQLEQLMKKNFLERVPVLWHSKQKLKQKLKKKKPKDTINNIIGSNGTQQQNPKKKRPPTFLEESHALILAKMKLKNKLKKKPQEKPNKKPKDKDKYKKYKLWLQYLKKLFNMIP